MDTNNDVFQTKCVRYAKKDPGRTGRSPTLNLIRQSLSLKLLFQAFDFFPYRVVVSLKALAPIGQTL